MPTATVILGSGISFQTASTRSRTRVVSGPVMSTMSAWRGLPQYRHPRRSTS